MNGEGSEECVEIDVVVKYTTWYFCNSVGFHVHINNDTIMIMMRMNVIVNLKGRG